MKTPFIISAKKNNVIVVYSLFVCLLTTLCKKFRTHLHETFREGRQWASEKMIKFWWRSDNHLGTGIVFFWIRQKHTNSPDGGNGKTCLGGGMRCPSASIYKCTGSGPQPLLPFTFSFRCLATPLYVCSGRQRCRKLPIEERDNIAILCAPKFVWMMLG